MKIEIDGKEIEAEAGSMIIQVADKHAIPIPRFCYHSKLSIAANCRMCLVQVEKSPKPVPACATPIAEGMKIFTTSPIAVDSQKAVMEYLLINHPLDCPICDQGGECELQDLSMEYGNDFSRYDQQKRTVLDKNLGPLISTDMTRCIQCTRCVRFGAEVAGERELGATGRSEFMKIETFVEQHVNSEVSGNIIDICPVGALTSKPFRFKARAWELKEYPNVSPHDCIGSNLNLHVLREQVLRVVPREAEDINEVWISDRDRFSYEAIQHEDRLRKPMLESNGKRNTVSWAEALKFAVSGIKMAVDKYGGDHFGVLTSPSVSLEELYLLQQFTRGLGSYNIDHRLREQDFSDQDLAPLFPNLGVTLNELEQQDFVLLVGSNIHKEQPIAGLKLRKISNKGKIICAINPIEYHYNFPVASQVVAGAQLANSLAAILKEILRMTNNSSLDDELKLLQDLQPNAQEQQIAAKLLAAKQRVIILGQQALMHPRASEIRAWGNLIAKLLDAKCGCFTEGSNTAGAWITGCVPHRLPGGVKSPVLGKNAMEMLQKPLRCYIVYGLEPEFDSLLGNEALSTLKKADFVIAITSYQSETLLEVADVLLPLSLFAESPGTRVNLEGKWQTAPAAIVPYGESKPGWQILRLLASLAGIPEFEYDSTDTILETIKFTHKAKTELGSWEYRYPTPAVPQSSFGLVRIAPVGLYAIDAITRRASSLQKTRDANHDPKLQINQNTANQLHVADGELVNVKSYNGHTKLQVEVNVNIPDFCTVIMQAHKKTNSLGLPYGYVEVHR